MWSGMTIHLRSTNGGASWSGTERITWSGSSSGPALAVDSSDTIGVVWIARPAINLEVFFRSSTNGGVSWNGAKKVTWTSGETYNPAIAMDSSNSIHLVWTDFTPGNYEIYYKKDIQ